MGGSSGGGGNSKTQTLPPPQLSAAYQTYGNLLNSFMQNPGTAFNQYQGQTYANNSPYTGQAISALTDPSAYLQAQNYYQNTLNGDYMGLNPQFQQAVMNPAIQGTNASFNSLGRYGSQANADTTAEAAMRTLAPYYAQERQYQNQAAAALPLLQQNQAGAYQQAAGLEQGMGQRDIAEAQAQFAQQNYDPRLAGLQAYGGLLSPGSQYSVSTTQQPGGSALSGALGGASLGAGAFYGLGSTVGAPTFAGLAAMGGPYTMLPYLAGGALLGSGIF